MKNSDIEQYYFEMFRRDYPLPEGVVEYGDKPDVILRGARTIGIEIRNFFLENGGKRVRQSYPRLSISTRHRQARNLSSHLRLTAPFLSVIKRAWPRK